MERAIGSVPLVSMGPFAGSKFGAELGLTYRIVHGLVDRWTHPTPLVANGHNLRHLESSVIT